MKRIAPCLLFLILFSASPLLASDAPVTAAGIVTTAVPGPVPVPVTVTGFTDIGKFTLTMNFNTTRVQYVSAATHTSLPGMTVSYIPPSSGVWGMLVMTWTGAANVSLADGSSLAVLTFTYITGTGMLTWDFNGTGCSYKRYVGGVLTALNDLPTNQFYFNGGISGRGAPVTIAPVIIKTAPGAAPVTVTVNDFTTITNFSLKMEYDPGVVTYLNTYTKNPAFGSSFQVGDQAGTGGKREILIGWYGSAVTLSSGASLCTLNFNYISSTGAVCPLTWLDNGASCEYSDNLGVLIDFPSVVYYQNGGVVPPLVADFVANNLTPLINETVMLTDLTTGGATSWNWSFDRPGVAFLNGTAATSQSPQVKFTEGGLYTVTLAVSNNYLTDNEIKTGYIRAGTPGIWTGATSSDWTTATNWENWLVPGSGTAVVIPSAALNWPVFTGNLTVGSHCASITMSGSSSRMTVTGILTIP